MFTPGAALRANGDTATQTLASAVPAKLTVLKGGTV
jgi:hypothetical protein